MLPTKEERLERMPWVEKYNTVHVLKKNLETANLPHMLFYGPPGTGKTSTILAMAKELYGPQLIKSRVLELNASDERGISIVREKIKNFARLSNSNPTAEDKANYPCPPYKLIILDEADSMTADAQSALRRTMETYSGITRFCLICNYITRIIDPLASRCSKFRFKSLDSTNSLERMKFICDSENVKIGNKDEVLNEILKISDGDLRKAINFLQSLNKLLINKIDDDDVVMLDDGDDDDDEKEDELTITTGDQIRELFGYLPTSKLSELLSITQTKQLNSILDFLDLEIFKKGYNASLLINSLHDRLLLGSLDNNEVDLSLSLNDMQKNQISKILFDTDFKLSNGSEESIQVLNCIIKIAQIF
ncbi:hypothetical protein CANARDRAFT_193555 [[Candida] arabinofermentans NRRL YB-2248]|uniref:AAA+ ATPase domain-containing protein n=1 Tax=[Candida] arabinofermentans NRRL YB-2248 TaxID=983967 RepID=A0A1E4T8G8_9ASCO|nr:hypothetical protein CANARDRAFT_193555 [[Candida] arabinofermentans NRRL YB-2248]